MRQLLLVSIMALGAAACAATGIDKSTNAEIENAAALTAALDAQDDDAKARYQYRHPRETLAFFGVTPGMTVVDTIPGEPGWYGKILIPYLGADGKLVGADYSLEMWPLFTGFATEEFLEKKKTWTDQYIAAGEAIAGESGADIGAFVYGSAPDEMANTVDVVLMMRAAHHFNRFEEGRFFTQALADIMKVLKPGGVVGVVQHRAQEDMPDEWAVGNAGYVKQSKIVSVFEAAGFEFDGASEINANPADRPTTEEFVWRLPPTYATSRDNPDLKAQMQAIGESDRMTLRFRKPE
jgi:predicted methyltransferase